MENMSKEEFMRQSEAAVRRMQEMNRRSGFTPSTRRVSNFNTQNNPKKDEKEQLQTKEKNQDKQNNFLGINLPFLDFLKNDSDITIIVGILLLLLSDNSDKLLLLALLYILM